MTQQRGGTGQAQAQDRLLQRRQVLQAKNIKLEGTAVPARTREVQLQAHHLRRQVQHLRQGKTGHSGQRKQYSRARRLHLEATGHHSPVFHPQVQYQFAEAQQHAGPWHLRAQTQRLQRVPLDQAGPGRTQALLQREERHPRAWRVQPVSAGETHGLQVAMFLRRIGN